ncbi:MAG: LPS biosynthesis protein [Lentisphaeria bacterium]|nr:LPS biosynthesis protein [Lentisphaeria bacterium]
MAIDKHPMECRAMDLFKQGEGEKASKLQDEFLAMVKESGEDHCPCPSTCKFHGKCVQCVILHRGHGDHLPYCMRQMLNERIETLSALSEHSFEPPPRWH